MMKFLFLNLLNTRRLSQRTKIEIDSFPKFGPPTLCWQFWKLKYLVKVVI